MKKSGTVAVIGRANAGKSTLVNVLVGEKVAIVSPKPQTTRDRILGILNTEGAQIVFADTPGIYKSKTALSDRMMRTAESSAKDVDLILYVHDGHKGVSDEDVSLMRQYRSFGIPMLIAYTKTDIMPAENIPADAQKLFEAGVDRGVIPPPPRPGARPPRKGTRLRPVAVFGKRGAGVGPHRHKAGVAQRQLAQVAGGHVQGDGQDDIDAHQQQDFILVGAQDAGRQGLQREKEQDHQHGIDEIAHRHFQRAVFRFCFAHSQIPP